MYVHNFTIIIVVSLMVMFICCSFLPVFACMSYIYSSFHNTIFFYPLAKNCFSHSVNVKFYLCPQFCNQILADECSFEYRYGQWQGDTGPASTGLLEKITSTILKLWQKGGFIIDE